MNLDDNDKFGKAAEAFTIFFGTPTFLIGQTIIIALWMFLNSVAWFWHWDQMPFMLLNFVFTIWSGYATPMILLAGTRQANREKQQAELERLHREELADETNKMIQELKDLMKGSKWPPVIQ